MSLVLGAVLAGGASSRFGSDKAAAFWSGAALADHAAAAIAPFCATVVRVGGGGVPDLPRAGLGPLGGIAGALGHARRHGFASVLTVACDMPRVPGELVEALLRRTPAYCADAPVLGHWPVELAEALVARLQHGRAGTEESLSRHAGLDPASMVPREQPAAVLAETWAPDQVRGDDGGRQRHDRSRTLSLRRWAQDIGALPIASPVPLANVNTPEDLLTL